MAYFIDSVSGYKLKIDSKRLNSGKYQVRFQANRNDNKIKYGYVLAKQGSTLKEVVGRIREELYKMHHGDMYFHAHLYSLGKTKQRENEFVVFDR